MWGPEERGPMSLKRIRSTLVIAAVLAALMCVGFGASFALANPGGDNVSDAIPTALPIVGLSGSLDSTTTDARDVYAITLTEGETIEASMTVTSANTSDTDFDLALWAPGTTVIDDVNWKPWPRMWGSGHLYEHWTFMAADAGTYYLDVHAFAGSGSYMLDTKKIDPVSFKIGSLSVPKSAKKGKSVKVSAVVSPAYNGYYSPVYMHFYRYERGKYRSKKTINAVGGTRAPGAASSKIYTTYKFPKKGKWRVRAEFWDEAHTSKWTGYKYITIK
jgi:hypothetical protein